VDPDGEFIFSLFLGPVGAIIDAACWSALFDAGIQGIKIATGAQENFNWAELGGAFIGGAVGGTMAFYAPSFSSMPLLAKYGAKAAYAGLTSAVSTGAGMFSTDLLDNGRIDYSGSNYLNAMGSSAGIGMGLSLATSAYSYATWDRYTPQQRIRILSEKYNVNIELNENIVGARPQWDNHFNMQKIVIGPDILEYNKGYAMSVIDHEYIHANYARLISMGKNIPYQDQAISTHYANEWGAHLHQLIHSNRYMLGRVEYRLIATPLKYTYLYPSPYRYFGVMNLIYTLF